MKFKAVLTITVFTLLLCVHAGFSQKKANKRFQNRHSTADSTENIGLKSIISVGGIGVSVSYKKLFNDERYRSLVLKEFNSITSENHMKMHKLFTSISEHYWGAADSIVEFAQQNKLRIHGHALVWHEAIPKWMLEIQDSAQLENLVQYHITTVVGRYKSRVASWDVYNEAIADKGDSIRMSHFIKILGKDFIGRAFVYAHKADPSAVLFYNDYNIESDSLKFKTMMKMLRRFRAQNVPIHGVGFQMHLNLDQMDTLRIRKHVNRAVNMQFKIHFSEVDIANSNENRKVYTDSLAEALAKRYISLAKIYKRIPPRQKYGLTFWNLTDGETWLKSYFKRKYEWPLLFDENYRRKKAYFAFAQNITRKINHRIHENKDQK